MDRVIEFTKDFATKKKGDKWTCGSPLASLLVRRDKVAKYIDGLKPEVPTSAMNPSDRVSKEAKRKAKLKEDKKK